MLSSELQARLQGSTQSEYLFDDEWLLLQIKDGACSAGCQYCYAKHEAIHEYGKLGIKTHGKTAIKLMTENPTELLEMPLGTVRELVSYISGAGIRKIAIIGSEPTEHSQYQEILELLNTYNIKLAIYTNGRDLAKLQNPAISRIILHLSCFPTHDYMKQVRALVKAGKLIDLRINFSHEQLPEKIFVDGFLDKLTSQEKKSIIIKYSITSRVHADSIEGFDIVGLKAIKNALFSYLEQLHGKHPDVTFFCERSLFKCCFTEGELNKYSFANITFKCSMEFIIYRDKKLKFCSPGRYLFDGYPINSANDIIESLPKVRKAKENIFALPSFQECRKCSHRTSLLCNGGCISYKASPNKTTNMNEILA